MEIDWDSKMSPEAAKLDGYIEFLQEEDGGPAMGIFYRGHCDIAAFCEWYNFGYGPDPDANDYAKPEKVRQCWARVTPSGELVYADKPGRGAWPITAFEW